MGRFDTQRRDANGQNWPAQPWVAVVRYSYSGEPMRVADRMINTLGFKVTSYRKSAEALVRPEPARADPSNEAGPTAEPAEQNPIAPGQPRQSWRAPPVCPYRTSFPRRDPTSG